MGGAGKAISRTISAPFRQVAHIGEAVGYVAQGKDPSPALERFGRATLSAYGGEFFAANETEPTSRADKEAAAAAGMEAERRRIEGEAAGKAEAAELALRRRRFSTLLTAGRDTAAGERVVPSLGGAQGRSLLGG